MVARNSSALVLLLLAANACAGVPPGGKLGELRQMSEHERVRAFHDLDRGTKVELFFEANRRRPPYFGLNTAISEEGNGFLVRLREEIDRRGGVPEVLSFMSIVFDMKARGLLTKNDIQELRVDGICRLAKQSEYCSTLEAKILAN